MSRYLLVTQVYPPDTAAVGQHMADIAAALVEHGHEVHVITSDRGYDDPAVVYLRREIRQGVHVSRLGLTSFGKSSIALRLAGGLSLVAQATFRVLLSKKYDVMLLTTSPPMGALVGIVGGTLRQIPFDYWLMDLNPDQAVELGHVQPNRIQVRLFDCLNRAVLRKARHVITLDEAMANRFHAKLPNAERPRIFPVWAPGEFPHSSDSASVFERKKYGLENKRVVMYAGNHSIAHPLDGLLDAVKRRNGDGNLAFVFMGGGLAKVPIDAWIKETAPRHVLSLPYQPLEAVPKLLEMADVQVVSVGPKTVGIVHPSKVYGALAAARPILVIGPKDSPAGKLVTEHELGWVVEHGDVNALEVVLDQIEETSVAQLAEMGARALRLASTDFSRKHLIEAFVSYIEA